MPTLAPSSSPLTKDVLVVGNGRSCQEIPWDFVRRRVGPKGETPDVVLINRKALGKTKPSIAVSVDLGILKEFQDEGLHESSLILTNHLDKVAGPEDRVVIRDLIASPNFFQAPEQGWPAHASGPLAVWACAALGYRTIYLFGLDGSLTPVNVDPPADATPEEFEQSRRNAHFLRAAPIWETWISRFLLARKEVKDDRVKPKLVRVWPQGASWVDRPDPLAGALSDTVVVSPPVNRKPRAPKPAAIEPKSDES